jgi:hypothetical protein
MGPFQTFERERTMTTSARCDDNKNLPEEVPSWFRMPNRQMWHAQANREYGVIWSRCGIRALLIDVETRPTLAEDGVPCARCTGQHR